MARLEPLTADNPPAELRKVYDQFASTLGFVPNSVLIMQRRPKVAAAVAQLAAAIWDRDSTVDVGFKRLLAHVASRAHGCQYCMAHTAGAALRLGVDAAKLEAVWAYPSSPLFSEAERVALDFAIAAASVPNAVDDALFARLKACWSDDDIVEIAAVVSYFGFMNRWNDSMATPLESEPIEVGHKHLARDGWNLGKHAG